MEQPQQIMGSILHEKMLAQSIVDKCSLIEALIRQNSVLQQVIKKLQETHSQCQKPKMSV